MTHPSTSPALPALEAGRAALAQGAWDEARSQFQSVLQHDQVPEALEGLGLASWWLDDAATVFEARERAYRGYRERADALGAARVAIWLVWDYLAYRNEVAVASGWLERARRLLEGFERTPEYGWLLVREGEVAIFRQHDPTAALLLARRAAELGRSLPDTGVEMSGLALEGLALVAGGDVGGGMRRLDEATAAATAGEVKELHAVGVVCCWQMFACERVRDYDRAAQWCNRVKEFAKRWHNLTLSGVCRSQYAGVLIWRGDWEGAEAELGQAAGDLASSKPAMVGQALARLGELRLRQGRLDDAARLFERLGRNPAASLGRAALAIERGDWGGAFAEAERFLGSVGTGDKTLRAAGLELSVRAGAMLQGRESVMAGLAEIEHLAAEVGTEPLRASAAAARGSVASAQKDHLAASQAFEEAAVRYERGGAPFEAARARLELAAELTQLGQRERAHAEATLATRALRQLGAALAVERGEALVRALAPQPQSSGGTEILTRRQLDILRLVSQGLSNSEIARQLSLSEHTVKRHVANLLLRLGLSSRAAAAATAAKLGLL
jgi:LuxR family maltose regulon positive regulatory protein